MNTCGTCKYWGGNNHDYEETEHSTYRTCQAVIHDKHDMHYQADCKSDAYDDYAPLEERNYPEEYKQKLIAIRDSVLTKKAVVKDGSGYFAALKCREDFGCVLHEPAEPKHE